MKKLMLMFFLLMTVFTYSQTAIAPSVGTGYESSPYQISSLENLYWIASLNYKWDYYYIQTNDIDASSTSTWFEGSGWSPIGNETIEFSGSYDGLGHEIVGLYINTTSNYIGLFGKTDGADIKNIQLENIDISGSNYSGSLIGYNNNSNISNCTVTGTLQGTYYVGGIAGYNLNSNITRSTANINITGTATVGGLIGFNYTNSIISECFSTGNVTAIAYVGGISGYNNGSSIENSYSLSNVTGDEFVGGMTGNHIGGSLLLNCYSTGSVSGVNFTGGLIGYKSSSLATSSFWDIDTSEMGTSSGGTGKTTTEMKTLTTFTDSGWNFIAESVNGDRGYWNIDSRFNDSYPYLYSYNPLYEVIDTDFQAVWQSSADWGDYDNDGDLDFVISGYYGNSYNGFAAIYENNNNSFTNIDAGLFGLQRPSVSWGDYDNDGDLDLLLTGKKPYGDGYVFIYRNDLGSFTNINPGLTPVKYGSSAWGDYDNDGDLDVLHTGYSSEGMISKIYQNNNGVFVDIAAGLQGVQDSSVSWCDYDNDDDLDILLTGKDPSWNCISIIYNNNEGVFTEISAGLPGVEFGSSAWGDYDNDGDQDLALIGYTTGWPDYIGISKIYRNDSGVFTDINAGLTELGNGSVSWADHDNDGDLDILISGYNGSEYISKLYTNDGGVFTCLEIHLTGTNSGSFDWGDYYNDGDLDLLQTGYTGSGGVAKLYKNNSAISNTIPYSPSNITCVVDSSSVNFNWDIASDSETPQNGLSYNLFIRPFGQNYFNMSPMSDTETGYRSIVRTGNTGQKDYYTIKDLPVGRYTWSVQTVDHAFAGSAFAPEQIFTVGNVPDLPEDPIALAASNEGINTFKANWMESTGAEYYNLDVASDAEFTSLVTGFSNLDVGNVTSYTIVGLDINTDYYYRIRASNSGGSSTNSNTISTRTGYSSFTEVSTSIPGMSGRDTSWGDYDNDGDLDLFISGHYSKKVDSSKSSDMSLIYKNDSGIFTDIQAGILGVSGGNSDWGDYDNDGDLDLLMTGDAGMENISKVYRNDS
ncbi:MAG: hypothetical protein GQ534_03930, partial [Candidatus Delongbacteria bacterium]|nr:hypothetical protein [Candidatus Delongbacteria bacterium]